MLEGITVLNQTEIVEIIYRMPEWLSGLLSILILFSVCTIGAFVIVKWNWVMQCIGVFVFVAICIYMLNIFLNWAYYEQSTGKYEYQVTISDEVSVVEFTEKYEIIKQEGKIFTIVEKNQ